MGPNPRDQIHCNRQTMCAVETVSCACPPWSKIKCTEVLHKKNREPCKVWKSFWNASHLSQSAGSHDDHLGLLLLSDVDDSFSRILHRISSHLVLYLRGTEDFQFLYKIYLCHRWTRNSIYSVSCTRKLHSVALQFVRHFHRGMRENIWWKISGLLIPLLRFQRQSDNQPWNIFSPCAPRR